MSNKTLLTFTMLLFAPADNVHENTQKPQKVTRYTLGNQKPFFGVHSPGIIDMVKCL